MIERRIDWQHDIRDHIRRGIERRLGKSADDAPPLLDFGFSYPFEYVEMAVTMLQLSGFQAWPEPGGWAEQDHRLLDDVTTYLKVHADIEKSVKDGTGGDLYQEQTTVAKPLRMDEL